MMRKPIPTVVMLLLAVVVAAQSATITWQTAGELSSYCGAWTTVFDVSICVTPAAWSTAANRERCDHVANVLAQLLDNDADGVVDDAAVVQHMVTNNYVLWVPATEQDSDSACVNWIITRNPLDLDLVSRWMEAPCC